MRSRLLVLGSGVSIQGAAFVVGLSGYAATPCGNCPSVATVAQKTCPTNSSQKSTCATSKSSTTPQAKPLDRQTQPANLPAKQSSSQPTYGLAKPETMAKTGLLEWSAQSSEPDLRRLPESLQHPLELALPVSIAARPQKRLAQATTPDPNRDRILQPDAPLPTTPIQEQPVLPTPEQPAPSEPSSETTPETPRIAVQKIEVTGSTILREADLQPITQKVEGQSVTLDELRAVADAITQIYLDRGYITSRAILVDQTITDGIVRIQIVEGSVERIEIEGTRRLRSSYVRDRVELGTGTPLRQDKLEDQLRLLKVDPLFSNIEASLRPGTQLGQSILTVRVTEAFPFFGYAGIDNYSPPSVGSVRGGGLIGFRNLTGLGDEISGSIFATTTGGANVYDLNYRVPLNSMNGTLQLRAAPSNNRITAEEFEALEISGENEVYEISFRQPLIRTPREEFALSLGFTLQDGQTFIFNGFPFGFGIGPDEEGVSRTRVLKFGQDYVKRDLQGAWALRSQFNLGLGIFDATENEEPIPDGRFFSWLGQFQRVQRLSEDNLLIAQLDVQLTPNSLLPSQQFVVGGGQSVRGYRQNARSGDNGIRFSVEDRIVVARDQAGIPTLQFAPFFDAGYIWNKDDNPNELPNQQFLAAFGLGVIFQPLPQLTIRLDYAPPLINLDDRGDNAQDDGFYFSVIFQP
jgi:hemolysin activation/secretion protein